MAYQEGERLGLQRSQARARLVKIIRDYYPLVQDPDHISNLELPRVIRLLKGQEGRGTYVSR